MMSPIKAAGAMLLATTLSAWASAETKAHVAIPLDTDPGTRELALQRAIDWHGLSAYHAQQSYRAHFSFEVSSSTLSESDKQAVARMARQWPKAKVLIVGYADPTGSFKANDGLSKERAEAVVKYVSGLVGSDWTLVSDHSAHWPGHPDDARRVDLLAIPQL